MRKFTGWRVMSPDLIGKVNSKYYMNTLWVDFLELAGQGSKCSLGTLSAGKFLISFIILLNLCCILLRSVLGFLKPMNKVTQDVE